MLEQNSDLSAADSAYSHISKPNMATGEYIKTATAINDEADAYNKRGIAYCENGDYDRGIAQFNEAIALVPESVEVYYNRGTAYSDINELDLAIQDYTKVIQLEHGFPMPITTAALLIVIKTS